MGLSVLDVHSTTVVGEQFMKDRHINHRYWQLSVRPAGTHRWRVVDDSLDIVSARRQQAAHKVAGMDTRIRGHS